MPYLVAIPGRHVLPEGKGSRGESRGGGSGNCGRDVIYERRINKKKKRAKNSKC